MKDWVIGDKVVCIDASYAPVGGNPHFASPALVKLKEGKIYQLADIRPDPMSKELLVDVDGIANCRPAQKLPNFLSIRFRKLRPDKLEGEKEDWELLLKNNSKAPQKVKEPAYATPAVPMLPFFPVIFPRRPT